MDGKDLLNGLNQVDESLINEAEKKKIKINKSNIRFAIIIAASFAIIITAFSLWSSHQNNLPISPDNNIPPVEYTLYFNDVDSQIAGNLYIKGHFWEQLSSEQKEKLLPNIVNKYQVEGTVNYSQTDGKTAIFNIQTNIQSKKKNDVKITIAPNKVIKCYLIDGEPVLSEIEGVKIEAGIFKTDKNSEGERNYIYYADFMIEDIAYYAEFAGAKSDKEFFTSIIVDLILGGKADLSVLDNPTVPELRDEKLTENEAYKDTDFGVYLPKVPNGYQFNGATRFINQDSNYLFASWSEGYDDIDITISKLKEQDKVRIISVQDTDLYDMSLYPIPWADSMPSDTREIIENPIFKIEDLTVDILKMRGYFRGEANDPSGNSVNMRFSVLYQDILIELSTEGVNPEYLFDELSQIPQN